MPVLESDNEGDAVGDTASVLRIAPQDNVLVATVPLEPGQQVRTDNGVVVVLDSVPAGHKIAAQAIGRGESVIKFGVDIGTATREIAAGNHVHVHNLESERMRGDRV
jgi:altronate dehydratase